MCLPRPGCLASLRPVIPPIRRLSDLGASTALAASPLASKRLASTLLATTLLATPLALGLGACGGSKQLEGLSYADSAERAYMAAMEEFDDDNCLEADQAFREVRRKYPYSNYAALSELRIADCLGKEDKHLEAVQAYREFVRHHPSHSEVPYARYQVAHSFFQQIPSDWLLAPPVYERDQSDTERALAELRRFMVDFPEGEHHEKAQTLARKALRLLAQHELYVARFYLGRSQPKAAIGRLETVLNGFRGSGVEAEALWLMGKTYKDNLGKRDLAKARFQQLVDEYPYTSEAEKARSELRSWGK
jgi:outer membrane protein assembly factor BamD